MSYREYLPCTSLRPYVDCYWFLEVNTAVTGSETPLQRCLPFGSLEIICQVNNKVCEIFNAGEKRWEISPYIYCTGLYTDTAYWRAEGGTRMFGIRIKPEGLTELFCIPVAQVLNSVVDGRDILGKEAVALCDYMTGVEETGTLIRTAETFLLSRLANVPATHNYVREACRLIRSTKGTLSVEALSNQLYISKRQLERTFKQQMGATPKTYQRMIRFRAAYRYARSRQTTGLRWTDVSYESGYADQAHFIREFREFTGETPGILALNREAFFQTLEAS